MTLKEQLYEKLSAEYAEFIDGLKGASPDKIIDSAYEKVFKEDILSCFEYGDSLSEKEIAALLALDSPLDELYRNWLDTDVSYMDDLSDTIQGFAKREIERQNGIDGNEIAAADSPLPGNPGTQTVQTINGEVKVGDWVIAEPSDEYGCLVGVVTAIDKLGTSEHDTENETDDIHVDFTAIEYSDVRKAEFLEAFDHTNPDAGSFDELPLDDVLMAPEMLIRITELGHEEITRLANDYKQAEAYCNSIMGGAEPYNERLGELMERLDKNMTDYQTSLMGFGKRELVEMAGKIAAVSDSYTYLTTTHNFKESEIDYLLKFQNPLEIVADSWEVQRTDFMTEMSFIMWSVCEHRAEAVLQNYPLITDSAAPADLGLHRFMDVDLIDFLGKISEKVIVHYPNDWNIDIDILKKAAMSDDPEKRRLIWHVCSMGTHINPERDVFIRDSGAHEYMTDYHQNDPDMFGYYVEVTGIDGQRIMGNVFEVGNYADFANHLRLTALPLESVSLTYSDDWGVNAGKTITVPRSEYDNDRHRLMSESGNVTAIRCHPSESVTEISALLRDERSYRMSLPIGSQQAHLKKIADKLTAIREPQEPDKTPADKKRSIGDRIAEGNEKVKAYKAQNPPTATKHTKKEID